MAILCYNSPCSAGVAHPVERHLAKVEVASSSLVTRSIKENSHHSVTVFLLWNVAAEARKTFMQQSGGLLLPPVQKLVATFILLKAK